MPLVGSVMRPPENNRLSVRAIIRLPMRRSRVERKPALAMKRLPMVMLLGCLR